jgi:nucleoside-diphosphate-sugar epimerase|tara:strand:+ start:305 stop:1300 length:996 start_codon:yes stop_codon:yes gene_type:complete
MTDISGEGSGITENFQFYKNKNILIIGGNGFIGSHLTEKLIKTGANITIVGKKSKPKNLKNINEIKYVKTDLTELKECKKIIKNFDIVFQLAGIAGGIEYSASNHGSLFTKNSMINLNTLEAAKESSVEFYQYLSSVGIYPNKKNLLKEEDGFEKDPDMSHFGYGWAKRVGELQCKMFSDEFGMKISVIRPDNTYGPRDNFDPKQSRVIPSLIYKTFESNKNIEVWGSGNQKRTFVYVKDLIRGMLLGLEKHPKADPINISSGIEISIKEVVEKIIKISNKQINIKFDKTKPESSYKRCMDINKARNFLKFCPKWNMEEGLKETIEWYKKI